MNKTDTITAYCQDFLNLFGFGSVVTVETRFDPDHDLYQVLFRTDNPSILIGYHGDNLTAIQILLAQHLHTLTGDWLNLSINVNDYRERRQFTLHSLADTAVSRVMATGQPHSLPPMSAAERRLIHVYLADHPHVVTASQGQGRGRCVIVSPKS